MSVTSDVVLNDLCYVAPVVELKLRVVRCVNGSDMVEARVYDEFYKFPISVEFLSEVCRASPKAIELAREDHRFWELCKDFVSHFNGVQVRVCFLVFEVRAAHFMRWQLKIIKVFLPLCPFFVRYFSTDKMVAKDGGGNHHLDGLDFVSLDHLLGDCHDQAGGCTLAHENNLVLVQLEGLDLLKDVFDDGIGVVHGQRKLHLWAQTIVAVDDEAVRVERKLACDVAVVFSRPKNNATSVEVDDALAVGISAVDGHVEETVLFHRFRVILWAAQINLLNVILQEKDIPVLVPVVKRCHPPLKPDQPVVDSREYSNNRLVAFTRWIPFAV